MCTCMVVKRGNLSENQTIILHVITAQGGGGGGGVATAPSWPKFP